MCVAFASKKFGEVAAQGQNKREKSRVTVIELLSQFVLGKSSIRILEYISLRKISTPSKFQDFAQR